MKILLPKTNLEKSPLLCAAVTVKNCHLLIPGIVQYLVSNDIGVSAHIQDSRVNVLSVACQKNPEIVESLLSNKKIQSLVNDRDTDGWTPLHHGLAHSDKSSHGFSQRNVHVSMIQALHRHGADINAKTFKEKATPFYCLMAATAFPGNFQELLEELLKIEKIDVNSGNDKGWTPLHCACARGLSGCVMMLLEKGANVNARDDKGMTPLAAVCRLRSSNFGSMVKLLLESGYVCSIFRILYMFSASINATDDIDGSTPFHVLCKHFTDELEFDTFFGDTNLDLFARDWKNDTAAHVAIMNGKVPQPFVEKILEKMKEKTDWDPRGNFGRTRKDDVSIRNYS
jgi:ankyrin repeat protein